ncbi:MAG: S8 family serine peptidase [Leptolyngbyaceae cyanobacterium bins.302]|nr:S8 family serine peptidase [Leptolyngbyaceae cyanobacterium bins.302]
MKLFQRIAKQRAVAQGFAPKSSTETQTSFILEPILTPSAGIDGTEGTPDLAIAQLTQLPAIDLPELDFSTGVANMPEGNVASDFDGNLEAINFIDSLDSIEINENSWFESGVFTVGATGEVSIDFLFDGGGYQGELAIFSLDGMETLEPGSDAFVQETARRALSSSDLGYVVVSDATDAAKFSGSFASEGNLNSGDYRGVQTFQMRPGDRLGFMLVPNHTVQAVFDNPCDAGIRPLFSMSTANPDDHFQAGQIADVTGDGNTFVFEDLRLDGSSDRDYNDIVFQVRGATADAISLDSVIDPDKDWRNSDMGKALVDYAISYVYPEMEQFVVVDAPKESQPLIGIIDTGFAANNPDIDYSRLIFGRDQVGNDDNPLLQTGEDGEHGTHVLGIIGATQDNGIGIDGANDDAPIWLGRAVGSGQWADSLIEFVDAAKESGQPNAVVNLSLDLTQIDPDGSVTTRYELTPSERAALEYARQSGVLIVAAAGNDGDVMSALGQASQEFDNIITVGAADGLNRASYSSYGYGLDLLAAGGTEEDGIFSTVGDGVGTMAGTSVATAKVTGAIAQVWAVNPDLSYRQIIEILKATAKDVASAGFDLDTGAGLLNVAAAISVAKITKPEDYLSPEIDVPETWSGEGLVTPTERAANTATTGFDLAKIIAAAPAHLQGYARDSIPRILAEVQAGGITDLGQIAYILATAQHESNLGRWMEELASGQAYEGRRDLGNTQPGDGPRFKGRGYVQITGRTNYTRWSQRLGIDLVGQPQRASDPAIAAKVLVQGMRDGTFTGRRLSDYINGSNQDFINARRIVNGTDKATEIAQIARNYLNALGGARIQNPVQPPPVGRRPYSVRSGDTLWGIAQRELGNGNRWREITKDAQGQQSFTDAEARTLRVNQTVYLPVVRQIGIGLPNIPLPIPRPIPVAPGSQSRSPQLFQEAFERAGGKTRGWTPTGHAYRWGNGWTQEFRDPSGDRMLLMLEDNADKAYIMWGGNLVEYEFMGGAVGRELDGRQVFLGYPMTDENIFRNPLDGKRAVWQRFQGADGKSRIHNLEGFASVATWGGIGILYTDMSGAYSFLGMPTRREYIDGDTIWSDFQGGRIAYNRNDGRTEALRPGEQPSWRRQATQTGRVSSRVGNVPLNLRTQPNTGAQVLRTLTVGTTFKVLEEVSGGTYLPNNQTKWYKIEVNGQTGFVAAYYVDIINSSDGNHNGSGSSNEPPLHSNPTESNPLKGFVHPFNGQGRFTQGWKTNFSHNGNHAYAMDFAHYFGAPVYAMRSGRVINVIEHFDDNGRNDRNLANKANLVYIEHDNGYVSRYLHLKKNSVPVKIGDRVSAGQKIGEQGNSGWSTASHLHVAVHKGSSSVPFEIPGVNPR